VSQHNLLRRHKLLFAVLTRASIAEPCTPPQMPPNNKHLKRPCIESNDGPPVRKHFKLSLLPGSSVVYETESPVVRPPLSSTLTWHLSDRGAKAHNAPFFSAHAHFSNFSKDPGAIVVDKTHFIPLLEANNFQYMFLRPRRWGKSTFLNMLASYYDLKMKDSFDEVFGKLYIGKAPTESRNAHLILVFHSSTICSMPLSRR
jgi:hypothetical protein